MRHDVAKEVFRKRLQPEVYERAAEILDGFDGETGFNPGSQIIQIAGISVLDGIDHYIKERLRIKQYIRYMDDMVLLIKDKETAEQVKQDINGKLSAIGFQLHQEKTTITPIKKGVMFLGFDYRITEAGKVIMSIDPKKVKAVKKKLYRIFQKAKRNEISRAKVDESYQSWRSHAAKGNSWKLLQRMDKFYRELWRGEYGSDHSRAVCETAKGE